jgi:hygromycin-B 7''-O-kinase
MRLRPVLEPEAARAVVAPVQPDHPVTQVVRRTGGEVSTVYEIRGANGVPPLIVKIYAPQWRSKLIKEIYVYRLMARHGIRHIPRVLHASPFGTPALPWAHTVMTALPGRPLVEVCDDLTGPDLARVHRRMGELLAAVHRITQPHWGYLTTRVVDARPTNTAYMTDKFARRLRDFADLGGDSALARAVTRHVARHTHVFAGCATPVLCHNDFHGGNVLVHRGQITGYVDVEGAIAADPLLDVALTDYHVLRYHPVRRAAFLDGYGPVGLDWERIAIYRLHHALELWNWAARTGKPADRARATSDIEAALDVELL